MFVGALTVGEVEVTTATSSSVKSANSARKAIFQISFGIAAHNDDACIGQGKRVASQLVHFMQCHIMTCRTIAVE